MKPQIVMAGMLLHLVIVLITWIHSVDRNPNGGKKRENKQGKEESQGSSEKKTDSHRGSVSSWESLMTGKISSIFLTMEISFGVINYCHYVLRDI